MDVAMAYIAGFVDAEGSIIVRKQKNRRRLMIEVEVVNSYRPVLTAMCEATGCGAVHRRRVSQLARKPQWKWCVGARDEVRTVLALIRPYLIEKQPLADRALELL